jgi:Cu/Ag efflux protein CusF
MAILSVTVTGAVWATQRVAAKPCTVALPTHVAHPTASHVANLASVHEYPLAAGRIVFLDRKTGRVTIDQRGIGRFYLDPGVMVFHVQNPSLLAGLSAGDKVRFEAERDGKGFDITRLEHSN